MTQQCSRNFIRQKWMWWWCLVYQHYFLFWTSFIFWLFSKEEKHTLKKNGRKKGKTWIQSNCFIDLREVSVMEFLSGCVGWANTYIYAWTFVQIGMWIVYRIIQYRYMMWCILCTYVIRVQLAKGKPKQGIFLSGHIRLCKRVSK